VKSRKSRYLAALSRKYHETGFAGAYNHKQKGSERMDTVTQLQRAIDYSEAHLTDELKIEDIAAQSCMSSSRLQRIFSVLCDLTLGEYIRYRRLTLAGKELQEAKGKVIDAALKYGYESPESFSRAFTQFHGITPAAARSRRCALRSLPRISIQSVYERKSGMIEKMNQRGYTFAQHAIPVYYTKDMDKTVKWFEEVPGWYAGVVARDENGAGAYGRAGSFPGLKNCTAMSKTAAGSRSPNCRRSSPGAADTAR
jgi:AraC family transcriptional regulator